MMDYIVDKHKPSGQRLGLQTLAVKSQGHKFIPHFLQDSTRHRQMFIEHSHTNARRLAGASQGALCYPIHVAC